MRLRATIFVKLLVALVLPAVGLFAFAAYEVSRHDRMTTHASGASG